ncbi:hypothetical protein PMAYCL1PPCAC_29957 [Pristionchus mayeri]|uniref:Uncharacterized protein n=1 Tax=Pristionchus mayeri TaxID=1317129 RepID=A0AAN5DBY8_9BILA|nr:hypothetical protein PMAYCL1PPCAC_29957 [Pristionchus mayeri]
MDLFLSWSHFHSNRTYHSLAIGSIEVLVECNLTGIGRTRGRIRTSLDIDGLFVLVDDETPLVAQFSMRPPSTFTHQPSFDRATFPTRYTPSPRIADRALIVVSEQMLRAFGIILINGGDW